MRFNRGEMLIEKALILAGIFSGIPLLISSCVGLVVSLIQAATQVQEQSLQFLVKLVIVSLVIMMGWSWALEELMLFSQDIFLRAGLIGGS